MPVNQIQDRPTLKPNCVYVIPPDRELVIDGDSVTAREFSEPRGRRSPIDMFFRSVAAARGDGIAIILSGAGADGSVGIQAIREGGGVVMVQEPGGSQLRLHAAERHRTRGRPISSRRSPAWPSAWWSWPIARRPSALSTWTPAPNELRRIVAFLRARLGHDFSGYKRATVMRRVIRRMQVCRVDTLADYANHLLATPEEAKELFTDLLISVTQFFRDPQAFEALRHQTIRPLFDDLGPEKGENLRAWVVGCATGEEAYSLAILLHAERLRGGKLHPQIQIFATDLDDTALGIARERALPALDRGRRLQ